MLVTPDTWKQLVHDTWLSDSNGANPQFERAKHELLTRRYYLDIITKVTGDNLYNRNRFTSNDSSNDKLITALQTMFGISNKPIQQTWSALLLGCTDADFAQPKDNSLLNIGIGISVGVLTVVMVVLVIVVWVIVLSKNSAKRAEIESQKLLLNRELGHSLLVEEHPL